LYEFSDWAKTHQKTIQNIATIIGIFAAVWLAVNVALGIFSIVGAAAAVVMAALTSPITLVVLAIGALIGIIYLLYTHWDEIKAKAIEVWEQIKRGWERAADWFNETVLIPLADWFSGAWEDIKGFFGDAWSWIKNAWIDAKTWFNDKVIIPISDFFKNAWEDIKSFPGNAWTSIKEAWRDAKTWFSDNVIDPLKEKFSAGLDVIKNAFETVFGGVKDFIRARINDIITFINTMISALASGINTIINALNSINVTIPSWVPVVGGNSWGISIPTVQAPQIPYLATGAVIPPNAAFAAVLGDQKSGRNIEAPEALIRQIVREESQQQGAQAVTVRFEGRMAPIVRLMNPVIEQERTRVGGSLIAAGARS
jgi:phage-related protein